VAVSDGLRDSSRFRSQGPPPGRAFLHPRPKDHQDEDGHADSGDRVRSVRKDAVDAEDQKPNDQERPYLQPDPPILPSRELPAPHQPVLEAVEGDVCSGEHEERKDRPSGRIQTERERQAQSSDTTHEKRPRSEGKGEWSSVGGDVIVEEGRQGRPAGAAQLVGAVGGELIKAAVGQRDLRTGAARHEDDLDLGALVVDEGQPASVLPRAADVPAAAPPPRRARTRTG